MKNDLRLLAHVPQILNAEKGDELFNVGEYIREREGKFAYVAGGWCDIDLGRHTVQTDAIRVAAEAVTAAGAKAYALADKSGRILQRYSTITAAEKARDNAVIRLQPELEVEPDIEAQPSA